jgi:hypothetical protein
MNRRAFIKTTGSVALLGALGLKADAADASEGSADQIVSDLVRGNDELVPGYLQRQERRGNHAWFGGLPDNDGIHTPHGTAALLSVLVCASCARNSKYFHATELLEPMHAAIRYLLKVQHDDGTIDLLATNFHSTPDTAFVLETLCAALTILQNERWLAHDAHRADLRRFIVRAGDALVTGGVHTPNHRWVVSGALARVNALFPDPKYVARIDQWLAEKIDIDPDGQYTEKSTGTYSHVVDRALLTVARLLDRPALFEPVRKNLEMTVYYVHPDGEVVTEASKRQDKYTRGSMGGYYYSYRALALKEGNGQFAAMARQIERNAGVQQLVRELPSFMEEPELQRPMPASAALPVNYAKVFSYSGLARIRRQDTSATILSGNSTLFSLRKGPAALEAVRVASAFFGKGQFISEKLEVADGKYVLRQTLDGPYFQPLSSEQIASGEHVRMAPNGTLAVDSRAARARSNVQHLESVAEIIERDGKFELTLAITGTDRVPVAVELAFRHGGELHGVEALTKAQDTYLLKSGSGQYVFGGQTIEFGPGQAEHTWTQLRGALPKWDGQSVYLTGFTPFKTTLTIG